MFSAGGGEKEPLGDMPEHSVFLKKHCSQDKIVNQGLIYWGYYQSITDLGEGKYPAPTYSIPPKTVGVRETGRLL